MDDSLLLRMFSCLKFCYFTFYLLHPYLRFNNLLWKWSTCTTRTKQCRSLKRTVFFYNQFAYQEQMKQNKIQNNLIPFIIENTFITLTLKLIMSDSWISHIYVYSQRIWMFLMVYTRNKNIKKKLCVKSRSIFDFEML